MSRRSRRKRGKEITIAMYLLWASDGTQRVVQWFRDPEWSSWISAEFLGFPEAQFFVGRELAPTPVAAGRDIKV